MCSRAFKSLVVVSLICQPLAANDLWTSSARLGSGTDIPSLRLASVDKNAIGKRVRETVEDSSDRVEVVESIETHMRKTIEGNNYDSYVKAKPSPLPELMRKRSPLPRGDVLPRDDERIADTTLFTPPPESPFAAESPTNTLPTLPKSTPTPTPSTHILETSPPGYVPETQIIMGEPMMNSTYTSAPPQTHTVVGNCPSCSGYSDAPCSCFGFSQPGGTCSDLGFGCEGSAWEFGGWLAGGTTINDHGNRTSIGNAPLGFNNYANGPVLNQAWVYAGKAADTGGCGFDWGCRMDFMFGADGPDTQAFGDGGWDDSWDTSGQYGFAMPQFYGELAWNRLTTRIGHFYTIIGYEVVQAPDNFFYSHAYTMYYNEPFTHTGILAQYDWTDDITLWGGWTAGWDSGFGNRNDGSTFLGGASWSLSDVTFIYATTFGDPGDGFGSDVYMHSLIADFAVTDRINYVLQNDYQTRNTGGVRANSYGINQYLFYQLTEKLSVGARLEWFNDDAGARIGNGPGDYWGLTLGANYSPHDRWILRNELRWDWFDGAGAPYDNNTERSQFTLGSSAVYLF